MSAAGSEQLPTEDPSLEPLAENDRHGTRMAYDQTSKVPWWVVGAWVCFAGAYVIYQLVYLIPSLRDWFVRW